MPRVAALVALCRALANGTPWIFADRDAVREALLAIPGIGPWTADYIALRHSDIPTFSL
jgi:AraC family transcriptional regulator of adaptative response / DNA-3-methyladenine glycosylase II